MCMIIDAMEGPMTDSGSSFEGGGPKQWGRFSFEPRRFGGRGRFSFDEF